MVQGAHWHKKERKKRKGTPHDTTWNPPLSEGQLAHFLGEGTKALTPIANRLGTEVVGSWSGNGKAMQSALFEALDQPIFIDCDDDPYIPDGVRVEEHHKGGRFIWSPVVVMLFLSEEQQNGRVIKSDKLRKELEDKPGLNANVLDFLLRHEHLIPKEWKGKYVFFWRTVYRDRGDDLLVRCPYWDGGMWSWRWRSVINGIWSHDTPAAVYIG